MFSFQRTSLSLIGPSRAVRASLPSARPVVLHSTARDVVASKPSGADDMLTTSAFAFGSLDEVLVQESQQPLVVTEPLLEEHVPLDVSKEQRGVWGAYLAVLESHPLLTKSLTSLLGFGLGDAIAQSLVPDMPYDPLRTAILAAYGFFVDAPAGNAFYNWMDSTIDVDNPKSAGAVLKKIAIDQLIYAPIFTVILYTYLQIAHGDAAGIPETLQTKVVPTLMANYAVWPLAHGLNFYYVPTEQRILYNNAVAICWTTWLSTIAH